ncbi:unnamed protein product, partial [Staurois parvus]
MDTDRWHFWGHTDHQGTLIISALMISVHVPSAESRADHMTEPTSSALSVIGDPPCPRDTAHRRSLRCTL